MMKDTICVAVGLVGGFFTAIFGGWDSSLVTLVVFMAIDFFTGIITAMMKNPNTRKAADFPLKPAGSVWRKRSAL